MSTGCARSLRLMKCSHFSEGTVLPLMTEQTVYLHGEEAYFSLMRTPVLIVLAHARDGTRWGWQRGSHCILSPSRVPCGEEILLRAATTNIFFKYHEHEQKLSVSFLEEGLYTTAATYSVLQL